MLHLFSGCHSSLLAEAVLVGSTCPVAAGRIQVAHTVLAAGRIVLAAGRMVLGPGHTDWATHRSNRSEVRVNRHNKALEVDTILALGQRHDGPAEGIEDRRVALQQEDPGLVSRVSILGMSKRPTYLLFEAMVRLYGT